MTALEQIPAELRERPQWVVWRLDERDGKQTKVPYRAEAPNRHASAADPSTWSTFEAALMAADVADGIGYVFSADDPYCGVDLDEEMSEADRSAIMVALNSYAEESVSGRGVHVIVRATLNGHRRNRKGAFEVYDAGRYFVMTGLHIRGTPESIEERQAELEMVLAEFLPQSSPSHEVGSRPPAEPVDLDDQELLEVAIAAKNGPDFEALWTGRWQDRYGSQSEADLALAGKLAFWTGRDFDRVDRLFRASGLMRQKWLRDDYRARTIEAAIAATNDVFKPSARNVGPTSLAVDSSLSELREVPTDIPGGCDLEAVLGAFGKLLVLRDPGAIIVALASIVANYAPGDPVWPLIVGPPGGGKSEIISALRDAPQVWPLSSLTPQTLLSGFERKGKAKGPPASMLLQIGSFGILAFKDLTTVLTMHREARAQIIGQLREVADGRTEKSFGNGLRLEWEGKMGFVAGVTPVIDEQHSFLAVMGERFVLYRLPEVSRPEITRRALERRGHEQALREEIRGLVSRFLGGFRNVDHLELPHRFTEPLIALADIVTRARSGVARDYQTRDILYLPDPEAPTRFAKQIAQLMAAMIAIGVDENEAWRVARKVGWDSVPAVRTTLFRLLREQNGDELTRAEIQEQTQLPETTIRRVEEDLVVLGLATRRKDNNRWLVSESDLARDYEGVA